MRLMMARRLRATVIFKGGPGSGFHRAAGHYGIPGRRGGSSHVRFMTKRAYGVMSHANPANKLGVQTRAAVASMFRVKRPKKSKEPAGITYRDGLFFDGDLSKVSGAEEVYARSHPDVQKLADDTGLVATDKQSMTHIQKLLSEGRLKSPDADINDNAEKLRKIIDPSSSGVLTNVVDTITDYNVNRPELQGLINNGVPITDKKHFAKRGVFYDAYVELAAEKANGTLTGDALSFYDSVIEFPADSLRTQLKLNANVHQDSLSMDEPLLHETRVASILGAFEHAVYNRAVSNGDYPVYDIDGNIVGHQLSHKEQLTKIRAMLSNPNATIDELSDVYQFTMSERSKLRDGYYYTPNGDQTTRDKQTSRSYYSTTQRTIVGRTTNVDASLDYLKNHYGSMKLSDLRTMVKNSSDIIGDASIYNYATGKGSAPLEMKAVISDSTPPQRYALLEWADRAYQVRRVNGMITGDVSYRKIAGDSPITTSDVDWSKYDAAAYVNSGSRSWSSYNSQAAVQNVPVFIEAYKKVNSRHFTEVTARSKAFDHYAALSFVEKAEYEKIRDKINADKSDHHSFNVKLRGVYKVIPSEVTVAANKAIVDKIGGDTIDTYHGTDFNAARFIASTGFELKATKTGRMLGDGIYITNKSSKAGQYIGERFSRASGTDGVLFIIKSTLGKVYRAHPGESVGSSYWNPILKKYDTVWAEEGDCGLMNQEATTAHPAQNLVSYWIDAVL